MMKPAPPIPKKRRPRIKAQRQQPAPPPVTPDAIVSVAFGPGADQISVAVSSAIVGVGEPPIGMWIYTNDGDPIMAVDADTIDETHVVFTFAVDVSAAISWHVEDPSVWEWEDGGAMNEPFDGPLS